VAFFADRLDGVSYDLHLKTESLCKPGLRRVGAGLVVVLVACPLGGLSDYLPVIGPAPLRFAPLPKTADRGGLSLLHPDNPPASSSPASSEVATNPDKPLPDVVTVVKSPGMTETNGEPLEFGPWPAPMGMWPSGSVSNSAAADLSFMVPQIFWPLFQRKQAATNAVEPEVITPVMFLPPTRAHRPGSKATYAAP